MSNIIQLGLTPKDRVEPCPFCGGTDIEIQNTHTPSYWMACQNPKCRAEVHGEWYDPCGLGSELKAHEKIQAKRAASLEQESPVMDKKRVAQAGENYFLDAMNSVAPEAIWEAGVRWGRQNPERRPVTLSQAILEGITLLRKYGEVEIAADEEVVFMRSADDSRGHELSAEDSDRLHELGWIAGRDDWELKVSH